MLLPSDFEAAERDFLRGKRGEVLVIRVAVLTARFLVRE
jgi:hypothetical protein